MSGRSAIAVTPPPARHRPVASTAQFMAVAHQKPAELRWGEAGTGIKPPRPVSPGGVFAARENAVPLLELGPLGHDRVNQCRWPLGEVGTPGFGFCGEPTARGRSYCEHHHHRGHTGEVAIGGSRGKFKPTAKR